jgi:hypothetical protein
MEAGRCIQACPANSNPPNPTAGSCSHAAADAPQALHSISRVWGWRRQLDVSVALQCEHWRIASSLAALRWRSLKGRFVPLSFLYWPHALHSTACVSGSRRQLLVWLVPQLEHVLLPGGPVEAVPAGKEGSRRVGRETGSSDKRVMRGTEARQVGPEATRMLAPTQAGRIASAMEAAAMPGAPTVTTNVQA